METVADELNQREVTWSEDAATWTEASRGKV